MVDVSPNENNVSAAIFFGEDETPDRLRFPSTSSGYSAEKSGDQKLTTSSAKSKAFIDRVEISSGTLTGRGGLSLFVRYLRGIGLYPQLETFFDSMRRSRKGQAVSEVLKQLFCFFMDGTSRHLVHFDALSRDAAYAGALSPFCSGRTNVSGPIIGRMASAASDACRALTPTNTISTFPIFPDPKIAIRIETSNEKNLLSISVSDINR